MIFHRILSAFVGAFLFPGYTIIKYLLTTLALAVLGVVALVAIPLIFTGLFKQMKMPLLLNLALQLFVIMPLAALALTGATLILIPILAITCILDVIYSFVRGISLGIMHGFSEVREQAILYIPLFLKPLFSLLSGIIESINQDNVGGLNGDEFGNYEVDEEEFINSTLYNEHERPLDVNNSPDLEINIPESSNQLLSDEEISNLNLLITTLNEKENNSPQFSLLKTRLERYQELSAILAPLKTAVTNDEGELCTQVDGELDEICDERLMNLPIKTPILFFQQQKINDKWSTVIPATTYLADKENLLAWLTTKKTHPITRDPIDAPSAHNGNETRYVWHTIKDLKNPACLELIQNAKDLRNYSTHLNNELANSPRHSSNPNRFLNSAAEPANDNTAAEEEDLRLTFRR